MATHHLQKVDSLSTLYGQKLTLCRKGTCELHTTTAEALTLSRKGKFELHTTKEEALKQSLADIWAPTLCWGEVWALWGATVENDRANEEKLSTQESPSGAYTVLPGSVDKLYPRESAKGVHTAP